MSTGAETRPAAKGEGVNYYTAICVGALIILLLALGRRGFGSWSLFPVFIGALGIATRWSLAPTMVVLATAACLSTLPPPSSLAARQSEVRFADVVLCGAVLAYVAGHYRLQSLTAHVFPPEQRARSGPRPRFLGLFSRHQKPELVQQQRPARLVTQRELTVLLLSLPIWALAAQVCWNLLPSQRGNPGLPPMVWKALLAGWILGLAVLVPAGFFTYLSRRRMSTAEATMVLQDAVWEETRREQRRLNRWLAWAKLRRHRRNRP